jgi:6-pyruvoyltetrahydropterin/6-carboxytetrahydropterin synthase
MRKVDKMKPTPVISIMKRFTFDSAHRLIGVPEGHPCGRLHGHTYILEVELKGVVNTETGWLKDYGEIKEIVKPFVDQLDHNCLNDIEGLTHTTSEEIAQWFWNRIKIHIPELYRIGINETPSSSCNYFGEFDD